MVPSRMASSVAQRQVRHVTPVPAHAATGLVADVYEQVGAEMRLVVPPALLHSVAPDVLAAFWMLIREPLVAAQAVDRGTREAVAVAVSVANLCPYCVEMHSVNMYELSGEHDAEAVAGDQIDDVTDARVRPVADWARSAHELSAPVPLPGSSAAARAELAGVVVCMHYLARMVNVFLSNFLLPPRLGPRARRRFKWGVSRILRPTLRDPRAAGRSLRLLPAAPLPADAAWATASPPVAEAVARASAVFEAAGARSLPGEVREAVLERLARWRGEDPGLGTGWCEDVVADLPARDRPAARLALLTALASYRVDDRVVGEFRRDNPDDRALVEVVGWASFTAARLIGSRLA
jgi:alkylhydroperoxidase family enzyme